MTTTSLPRLPMFAQRALVTLTLGPLALYLIYLGGLAYFIPILLILTVATVEYVHLLRQTGLTLSIWVLLPAAGLQWFAGQWPQADLLVPAMALGLFLVMGYALWLYEFQKSEKVTADWMAMMGGVILMGWVGSHFFRLRGLSQFAWQWTMLAMLGTWIADSAAYLVGKFLAGKIILGRHQLSPRLSPNKTVEGYAGGVLFALIVSYILASVLVLPVGPSLLLALLVSAVSPLGDLGISLLKREAGVKDSGHLLPGHGGALDRIDSLVWSVTIAYYFVLFIS